MANWVLQLLPGLFSTPKLFKLRADMRIAVLDD